MELLRELMELQEQHGFLADELLEDLAKQRGVPRYHLEGLVSFYTHFRRSAPAPRTFAVCRDVACAMHGGQAIREALGRLAESHETLQVTEVSCLGRCDTAPAIAVNDVAAGPVNAEAVERLLDDNHVPWLRPEKNGASWRSDPYDRPADHFNTAVRLAANLEELSATCLERLQSAGLRGMGGAGFPTGRKWQLVASEPASPKYVICNADESEPGTFKDRVLLASLPHLVIEGLVLAGLTTGADRGIVFLRHEYEPERRILQQALDEARQRGVLGENACGSGRSFDIEIFVSPGGYILGEETALLEALEDRRGEPRHKPPYPGQQGLNGQPTLINNVETFVLAVSIIHHGADWWQQQGEEGFAGLKFVSISGDITQAGVYEVPVGTTIESLIERAGGLRGGRALKAFLPGGASSRFLPAGKIDTPLDFDAVEQAGSMLGTGAVIVATEDRDLFELATNLVRFFRNESCGKCVPCRIGSDQAVSLLEAVANGSAAPESLDILSPLGETLEQTSICGLGQVALVPVLSMLEHFPEEVPGQ